MEFILKIGDFSYINNIPIQILLTSLFKLCVIMIKLVF